MNSVGNGLILTQNLVSEGPKSKFPEGACPQTLLEGTLAHKKLTLISWLQLCNVQNASNTAEHIYSQLASWYSGTINLSLIKDQD